MTAQADFLGRYLRVAPLALASERVSECRILAAQVWERPILDLGCGDGIFASVALAGRIETGVDPNPADIAQARRRGVYDELLVCNGDAIPLPDRGFATAFSNSVLEHIADPLPVLREMHRQLRPGGRFYVTVPTERFEHAAVLSRLLEAVGMVEAAARFRTAYNRFWQHHNALPAGEWERLFLTAGFIIDQRIPYNPRNLATINDLLVGLAIPAFLCRRATGRWIALPGVRRLYSGAISFLFRHLLRHLGRGPDPTLAFFALVKPIQ